VVTEAVVGRDAVTAVVDVTHAIGIEINTDVTDAAVVVVGIAVMAVTAVEVKIPYLLFSVWAIMPML
jgi:hypothetical protein